jgi:hypothetical protein
MLVVVWLVIALLPLIVMARGIGGQAATAPGSLTALLRTMQAETGVWCWGKLCPGTTPLTQATALLGRGDSGAFDTINSNPYLTPDSTSITATRYASPRLSVTAVGRPSVGEIEFITVGLPEAFTVGDLVAIFGPPEHIDTVLTAGNRGLFLRFPHGLSTVIPSFDLKVDPFQRVLLLSLSSLKVVAVQQEFLVGLSPYRWRGFTRVVREQ